MAIDVPMASAAKRTKLNEHADPKNIASTSASASSSVPPATLRQPRHLFTPYLALGIISNHVPFVLQIRHGGKDASKPDVNIVSSLGNSWSIWTAESLMQVFVGAPTPTPITQLALSTTPDSILASAGSTIYRFVRGKVVARYTAPCHISHFVVFGDSIAALATTPDGNISSLHHFSITTNHLLSSIDELPGNATPTALLHPATYLNKVLVGLSNGDMALWNIRTGSLVHQFDAAAIRSAHGLANTASASSILSLAQAPALDIVALTTADNCVLVHDIKTDTPVATFRLESALSASPPTFRTDGRAHTMAVGSRSGDIFIFDLDPDAGNASASAKTTTNTPRLIHTIRNAHSAPVSGLEFVAGQPLLISSASDNAIKQWFFEPSSDATSFNTASGSNPSGSTSGSSSVPRLLKSREGHSEPPSLVRWYGNDGRAPLLSAARDRSVRLGWIGREARGGELSQGSIVRNANQLSLPPTSLKLEAATSLSFSLTRSRDWDDILTIHPSAPARIWYGRDRRMNKAPLVPKQSKRDGTEVATTGFVTHCGNFALVGSAAGTVGMWNMQSQRFVRQFDTRPVIADDENIANGATTRKQRSKTQTRRGPGSKVVGVVADEGNTQLAVITSSGGIFFFDFYTAALLSHQQLHPLVGVRASPHATLLALIPLGLSNPLYLLDFVTRRVVRKFSDVPARITDVTFSPTLRSLLVATMDGSMSTFDIPSGLLIDRMRLREVIVSVDWSPDGSTVAGCGTEGKGIYLWSWTSGRGRVDDDDEEDDEDETASGVVDDVATTAPSSLPSVQGPDADADDEAAAAESAAALADLSLSAATNAYTPSSDPLTSTRDGVSHPLLTLSTQVRTKWSTLLHLELIKARDRPKEAPKKPKAAPFFLGAASAAPDSAMGTAEGVGAHFSGKKGGAGGADGEANGDAARESLLEQMTRRNASMQEQSHIEQLMDGEDKDGDGDGDDAAASDVSVSRRVFAYLLALPAPQLDLVLRMDLSTLASITRFLHLCSVHLRQARDYEAITAVVEALRRVRAEEMVGAAGGGGGGGDADQLFGFDSSNIDDGADDGAATVADLRQAWAGYLRAIVDAQSRIGDLLDFNIGTLSFLRGVPIV